MNSQELADDTERVFGDKINITTEGKRNLGAVIGSKEYKDQYCAEEVQGWKEGISTLAEIDKCQPHAAHIIFTKGSTYCMRAVESFAECVDPVQQVMDKMFLPTLFGQAKPLPDELGELVTLTRARGLGISDLTTEAPQQYSAPKTFTKQHVESIKFESEIMNTNEQVVEELKRDQRTLKAENTKTKLESIDAPLNPELFRLTYEARDKRANS